MESGGGGLNNGILYILSHLFYPESKHLTLVRRLCLAADWKDEGNICQSHVADYIQQETHIMEIELKVAREKKDHDTGEWRRVLLL